MSLATLKAPTHLVQILPYDDTLSLRGDRQGYSLGQMLEEDALDARVLKLQAGQTVRVYGTDGQCWADVTGVSPRGTAVLRPDAGALLAVQAAAPARPDPVPAPEPAPRGTRKAAA